METSLNTAFPSLFHWKTKMNSLSQDLMSYPWVTCIWKYIGGKQWGMEETQFHSVSPNSDLKAAVTLTSTKPKEWPAPWSPSPFLPQSQLQLEALEMSSGVRLVEGEVEKENVAGWEASWYFFKVSEIKGISKDRPGGIPSDLWIN